MSRGVDVGGCPYTWVRSFFSSKKSGISGEAQNLRVSVHRDGVNTVDVALPSRSARWLIELIPADVLVKIRAEGIPIDDMSNDLARRDRLTPQDLFLLEEPSRQVRVWLE